MTRTSNPSRTSFPVLLLIFLLGSCAGGAGSRPAASAGAPPVRDPEFSISSVRIERDLLVTTNLRLTLEIYNPNGFPLLMRSFRYEFYGEGKAWIEGGTDEPLVVPALASARRELEFTMNFADTDRRLFDVVARLGLVRYRLAGEARIERGPGVSGFLCRFDREGSCTVLR